MSGMPPVRILTAAQLKGAKWAAKYPAKADALYVVATAGKRRKVRQVPDEVAAKHLQRQWERALATRDLASRALVGKVFDDAVREFTRDGLRDHAEKTREGRGYQLAAVAKIVGPTTPLDHIDAPEVQRVYEVLRETRSDRTALAHLDALSALYRWHEVTNPVPEARGRIRAKAPSTAATRALNDANCRPVPPETMAKLWPRLSGPTLTTALLCHDAGLRIGEATGLEWSAITWGTDENDTRRSLRVAKQKTNGRAKDHTKSGRERTVSMSRRLRAHLRDLWVERGQPSRGLVVETSDHKGMNRRLRAACTRAKVDAIHFKDLRDTFASSLITHGIVLKWVSLQLGHGSVAVTERHYARYMAIDGYRNPWIVPDGENPSDLLAALESGTHQIRNGTHHARGVARKSPK